MRQQNYGMARFDQLADAAGAPVSREKTVDSFIDELNAFGARGTLHAPENIRGIGRYADYPLASLGRIVFYRAAPRCSHPLRMQEVPHELPVVYLPLGFG